MKKGLITLELKKIGLFDLECMKRLCGEVNVHKLAIFVIVRLEIEIQNFLTSGEGPVAALINYIKIEKECIQV